MSRLVVREVVFFKVGWLGACIAPQPINASVLSLHLLSGGTRLIVEGPERNLTEVRPGVGLLDQRRAVGVPVVVVGLAKVGVIPLEVVPVCQVVLASSDGEIRIADFHGN